MISDARALGIDARLRADVCIVGAGAAGITLALALRDAGLSVCLLEGGGLEIAPANQALQAGGSGSVDGWLIDDTRARVLGGSTAWWNGWCRPLQPDDFEERPYIPDSRWPFGYVDLLPYYERAHETVEIGSFEYDPEALSARCGKPLLSFDPSVVETRVYRFSPPTRFGERYRADLEQAADVRVHLNANLRRIRLERRGGPISHLECATLEGGRFTVEASRYVLALGGVENARMLLVSNAEQAEGVANGSGRVGQFMEHPHFYASGMILWRDPPDLGFYEGQRLDTVVNGQSAQVDVVGGLGLALPIRTAEGLPNLTATIEAVPFHDEPAETVGPARASAVFGRKRAASPFVRVTYRCEQTVSDESRLTLSSELDALGTPRIDLRWAIRESDTRAYGRSLAVMARELGRLGLGRLWDTRLTDQLAVRPSGGGHHIGTTRMSDDPARGVVDADGRAHEVDNLYILGSSVFPTGGDANPTLTIVALAHRMADHLRGHGRP